MPNVRIISDTACDLTQEEADALGVVLIPLSIRFGDTEYVDRRDLTPQEFWDKTASAAELPATAAPSPGAFETAFRDAAAAGCPGVVCVCLSSKLSATYSSAVLAAKAVEGIIDVRLVDSLSITGGQGTMVIKAADAANNGADLAAVEAIARSYVGRTMVYGAIDTLENLKKGGRIGGAQALIGSLLSMKPIVNVSSGEVEQAGKQRTRGKALAYLVHLAAEAKAAGGIENVAIMHGCADDVEDLIAQLSTVVPRDQIRVGQIGAVIGTHGGRGVMGLTFNKPVNK